jgi:hypothetical protein
MATAETYTPSTVARNMEAQAVDVSQQEIASLSAAIFGAERGREVY